MTFDAARSSLARWRIERVVTFKHDVCVVEKRVYTAVVSEPLLEKGVEHLRHLLRPRTRLRLRLAEQQSLLQHIARQVAVNAVSF